MAPQRINREGRQVPPPRTIEEDESLPPTPLSAAQSHNEGDADDDDDDDDESSYYESDDEFFDEEYEVFGQGCRPETWEEMQERATIDIDADDWEDAYDVKDVKMVIGNALQMGFSQYCHEVEAARSVLKEELNADTLSVPLLFDLIFGSKESKLFRCFTDPKYKVLKTNEQPKFFKFLATFYTTACYNISAKQLYSSDMISKEGLFDTKEEFIEVWKALSEAGLPKSSERARTNTPSSIPFWMALEESFNDMSSELFVQKYESHFGSSRSDIVIDDDKSHFARGSHQDHCGLKLKRHVNDNRMGNTLHSGVMSHSQLMVGVAYERVSGDSAAAASQRIIKRAYIPTAPGDSLGDLRHLGIARDRGYFEKNDVLKYILPSGAHIPASTVQRMSWLGASFGQNLSEDDCRVGKSKMQMFVGTRAYHAHIHLIISTILSSDISTKGPKSAYIFKTEASDREVFLHCYRNGTGGVVLSLSTEHRTPEFEMVPYYPPHLNEYEQWDHIHEEIQELIADGEKEEAEALQMELYYKMLAASFNMLNPSTGKFGPPSQAILDELSKTRILPMTREQKYQCWFWYRQFSLTSSTVDKIIMLLEGNESEAFDFGAWMLIKGIIQGAVPDEVPDYVPPDERIEEEESNDSDEEGEGEVNEDSSGTDSTKSPSDSVDGDDALADDDEDSLDSNGSAKFYDAHPDPERKGLLPNISKLRSNLNGEMEDLIGRLDGEEPHYAVSEEYVEYILTRLGGDAELGDLENTPFVSKRKLLLAWAQSPACFRRYFFEQDVDVLKKIGELVGCHGKVKNRRKPVPIRKEILKHLQEHPVESFDDPVTQLAEEAAEAALNESDDDGTVVELSKKQEVWQAFLQQTFLKPLSKQKTESEAMSKRSYCRRGHELEAPIVQSFLKDQQSNEHLRRSYPVEISDVCDAGLVAKSREEFHAKGSIDFVAVGTRKKKRGDPPGTPLTTETVGIEIKARLSPKTLGEEEKHFYEIKRYFESQGGSNSHRFASAKEKKYFKCAADSDDFARIVRSSHELIQLLHHAYIFNLNYVLLLIGDTQGQVVFGVLVKVDMDVREAYGTVLLDIREEYLGLFYDP